MKKLIAALTAILAAHQLYWEKNNKEDFPDLPQDDVWTKAVEDAEATLGSANQFLAQDTTDIGKAAEAHADFICGKKGEEEDDFAEDRIAIAAHFEEGAYWMANHLEEKQPAGEELQQNIRLIEDNNEGVIEEITVGRATSEEVGEEKILIIVLAGANPIILTKRDLQSLCAFHQLTEYKPKQ